MEENIIKPSVIEVDKYLDSWNSLENYALQENSLYKLFHKTYLLNNDIDDILIKVCSLNDFYSTNIYSPFLVAKHILNLNIDERLSSGDLSVVDAISRININNKEIRFYSFATKYCSHHQPDKYPIYDSYVGKLLNYFNKVDKFYGQKKLNLRDYEVFYSVIKKFSSFYGLNKYTVKQIDKYLWQAGKKYFPKNYGKKLK